MRRIAFAVLLAVASPAVADDIVRVTMIDLAVQTHKWDGKTMETSAYCFYADVDEFRCTWPGGARVDFSDIEPKDAQTRIEKNCDTLSKAFTRACLVKFRFVYDHFTTLATDDGGVIHIVVATDNKATLAGK